MSTPTPPDDDRTVIRPLPGSSAAGSSGAAGPSDEPTVLGGPLAVPATAPAAPADEHDDAALPVGTRLAEFELTRVLGIGGFGIVYLAHDHSLGRRVALKEYMPSALAARRGGSAVSVKSERHRETFLAGLKSFVNEARLLAQFDHPSLVKVYRFWEANGTAYMVMPFYEGTTLKDTLLAMGGAPDEAWLRTLLSPLTEALMVIHGEQCYHRDIAPDNIILLAGSGRPLLLDFGAARRVIGDMTQALTVILKPGYAPLEQYADVPGMKQGPWTDVYALAAVVYHAITGKTPPVSVGRMMGDQYLPLAQSHAGRYSPALLQAVDRALQVKPEDRTPSIEAFRADVGLGDAPAVATGFASVALPGGGTAAAAAAAAALPTSLPTSPPGSRSPDASGARPAATPTTQAAPKPTDANGPARRPAALWAALGLGGLALVGVGAFVVLTRGTGTPAPAESVAQAPAFTPAPAPAPAPSASPSPAPSASPSPAPSPATSASPSPAAAAAPGPAPSPAPAAAGGAADASAPPAPPSPSPLPNNARPPINGPADVLAEFERVLKGQASGFAVSASTPKTQLRIGKDALKFSITSAKDGHFYVLALGPDGSLTLLLPSAQASANRIKAGQTLNLPPPSFVLNASEPAGAEELLVVVSAKPRSFDKLGGKREDGLLVLPTGTKLAGALAGFQGRGSAIAGLPAAPCNGDDCWDYGAARLSVEVVK